MEREGPPGDGRRSIKAVPPNRVTLYRLTHLNSLAAVLKDGALPAGNCPEAQPCTTRQFWEAPIEVSRL